MQRLLVLAAVAALAVHSQQDPNRPVVIKIDPSPAGRNFESPPPRAVPAPVNAAAAAPAVSVPQAPQVPQTTVLPPAPPGAQQPMFNAAPPGTQQFQPRQQAAVASPPPVTIPPDVQNQLIKFFGLDSFGIPGLTGNHPEGIAGALQEMRAAGIPVQGIPQNQPKAAPADVLSQANPAFTDQISQLTREANNPGPYRGGAQIPLPADTPGENGLIGLLSTSIRKLVKDTGVADALSNSLPSVLGTQNAGATGASGASSGARASGVPTISASQDDAPAVEASVSASRDIRRKPSSPAQGVLSGLAAALGGGGSNSPTHAGLPRIPGIPLLPGGIPRNSQGQIDVVKLIGSVTRRISNGTTLADVLPPEQLQTLADNVTDALLPDTPQGFDLSKFMGRWFEGVNSPRATEQRCVVHHYGGLTKNEKTATFTALKIYREGSEFGPVKYSIGYAFRGGNKDAMLTLHSSEASDTQPFWIYKLGPEGKDPFGNSQYEYAIVSNWVKYPVTVLVRDPDTFKAKYQKEVLIWLEKEGFVNGFIRAFNMLQPASYTSCQYADSTFEVFGK